MQIINLKNLELSEVKHDSENLPVEWTILKMGDNFITRSRGQPINLNLSKDDTQSIVNYHLDKGAKIPIDCQHVVSNIAIKTGIDEQEIVKAMPRYNGVAGYGNLALSDDDIVITDVEFLPIAKELMKEGQFRYFSPVIRGLDGKSPLRVTSIALTNNPHLQNISSLSASDDEEDLTQKETNKMEEEKKKEEVTTVTASEPSGENPPSEEMKELIGLLKEVLGEDVTKENMKARLLALKTTSENATELSEKVKNLELAEESRNLQTVRDKAIADGKLTKAYLEKDYFQNMSSVELSEYCNNVPVNSAVPMGVIELGEKTKEDVSNKKYDSVSAALADAPVI